MLLLSIVSHGGGRWLVPPPWAPAALHPRQRHVAALGLRLASLRRGGPWDRIPRACKRRDTSTHMSVHARAHTHIHTHTHTRAHKEGVPWEGTLGPPDIGEVKCSSPPTCLASSSFLSLLFSKGSMLFWHRRVQNYTFSISDMCKWSAVTSSEGPLCRQLCPGSFFLQRHQGGNPS